MMVHVTGATGFIGQAVLAYCKAQNIPVTGYTRSILQKTQPGLVHITDYSLIDEDSEGAIIHLGEHNNVNTINPEIIDQQLHVVSTLCQKSFKKIVYGSSAAIYKTNSEMIFLESNEFSTTPYGVTKRRNEDLVLNTNGVVARMSNVFGHKMSEDSVLSTIIKQCRLPVVSVQTTSPIRDYVWISDVAKALVMMAQSKLNCPYHVSSGVGTSVRQLIFMCCEIVGNVQFQISETNTGIGTSIILDPSKTMKDLNWTPEVRLYDGLKKLLGSSS